MAQFPLAIFFQRQRAICFLLLLYSAALSVMIRADRPNIVLILADDLGYEALGCYGGTSYRTPHLDRLAAAGIRFVHAYSTPLCTPTRVQLMTGKYSHRNWKAFGILGPRERTFGHYMQEAGYKTCMVGKWQLTSYDPPDYPGAAARRGTGQRVEEAGFDSYSLWHTGHTETKGSRYADPVIFENGTFRNDTRGKFGEDLWAEHAMEFMERHRHEPFFLYYSMALPHNPFVPTPISPDWKDPEQRHRQDTAYFKDMVEYIDQLTGRLVGKLDQLGLRERTVILFYSDNGTHQSITSQVGDRRVRGGKGLMTDAGTRVPLIVNWPGKTPPNTVSEHLIDSTDFLPTFLEAAQIERPRDAELDGVSFFPQLLGKPGPPREWIYVHHESRPGWDKDRFFLERFARDQRFKLYEDGRLFLFPQDSLERHPILPEDDHGAVSAARARLQKVLDSMQPFPLFDPQSVPRKNVYQESFGDFAFQERDGLIVAEAEAVPLPRDESWRVENLIPGYTGSGYWRCLRDSPIPGEKGVVQIRLQVASPGEWFWAIRARSDHPAGSQENSLWLRLANGDWTDVQVNETKKGWRWIVSSQNDLSADREGGRLQSFHLRPGRHVIEISPLSRNLKIDRLVLYQSDRAQDAIQDSAPQAQFEPW